MSWGAKGTNITMAEGDYGVSLPFIVKGWWIWHDCTGNHR